MIHHPALLLVVGTAVVAALMFGLWVLGIRNRNFSYVDIGWSLNFVLLAALYGTLSPGDVTRRTLIGAMFAAHGLRLGWHLARRIIGEPEEGRYVQLRKEWGASGNLHLKFLAFFQFQALLNIVLTLPLLIACFNLEPHLQMLEIAAAVLFAVALAGETLADAQLAAFKRNATSRELVCDVGLWRYSRHPNYFFEWLIWVAYALFALASPYGWIALAMPLLMLHFLLNVTGVKATEEQALRSRGQRYREYQRRTSRFIPWIPRRT